MPRGRKKAKQPHKKKKKFFFFFFNKYGSVAQIFDGGNCFPLNFVWSVFWSRPVFGRLRLQEFCSWSRLWLLIKENIMLDFFNTDYQLSKILFNTCTSTYMSYFMFTLEKILNGVRVRFNIRNLRELLNKCLHGARARPK